MSVDLARHVRPGDGIVVGQACAEPLTLTEALVAQRAAFSGARLFLGDVGSGALGLLIAALGLIAWREQALALPTLLILCSAFITDASATLLQRMLHGRRWYTRHREHLYQWLVRAGRSHAAVVGMFAAWNVIVALPMALLAEHLRGWAQWSLALATYGLAALVLVLSRRWILRGIRAGEFGRMAT